MKTIVVRLAFTLFFSGLFPLKAEIGGIDIHWEKKVVGAKTGKMLTGQVATNTEDCTYNITLTNSSFKDAPAMVVKYIVFVERQNPGEKAGEEHIEKLKGVKPVEGIKGQQKATVETNKFTLKSGKLDAGWSYMNGGKTVAKDVVKGVWVRVYQGEKVVGEYVNPSTIRSREQWKF